MVSDRTKVVGDPTSLISEAVKLLGGRRTWKRPPTSQLEVHDAILKGMPNQALVSIRQNLRSVPIQKLSRVLGVSHRKLECRTHHPLSRPLTTNQGSRLWCLADIMAAAIDLQGSLAEAESWLSTPAIALDQRTPLDLVATPVGAEMVKALIVRLNFGVYT
jgi:putative toxin-antitoxin system antitoxin component (TIGR02293 family)